jgi:hypothetical protein
MGDFLYPYLKIEKAIRNRITVCMVIYAEYIFSEADIPLTATMKKMM